MIEAPVKDDSDPTSTTASLTTLQEILVGAAGNCLVTACPGAGKTLTLGARTARLIRDGKKVALTSYTNVGANELEAASVSFGESVITSGFAGTLNQFLTRYILRPFGHLVMGCQTTPSVALKPPDSPFSFGGTTLSPNAFNFMSSDTLKFSGRRPPKYRYQPDEFLEDTFEEVLLHKQMQARAGVVSAGDSMYWVCEVLKAHPEVAESVAQRFDELIVDEAQDTSALQMSAIDSLKTAGLKSLLLVGDYDQSIYSFQGARPQASENVAIKHKLERMPITENHRSSQIICNLAGRLRGSTPDRAVGRHRSVAIQPQLILYNEDLASDLVESFGTTVQEIGCDPKRSAILATRNDLVSKLQGFEAIPFGSSLAAAAPFIRISLMSEVGFSSADVKNATAELLSLLEVPAESEFRRSSSNEHILLRASLLSLSTLPVRSAMSVAEWQAMARDKLDAISAFVAQGSLPLLSKEFPSSVSGRPLSDFISAPCVTIPVSTIHGVKGKSLDAILLVGGQPRYGDSDADVWGTHFARSNGRLGDQQESARVLYVALTRAERYVSLAIPEDANRVAIEAFEAAGFQVTH